MYELHAEEEEVRVWGGAISSFFLVIGVDQLSKWLAIIQNRQLSTNTGVAFGFFSAEERIFEITLLMLAIGAFWLVRSRNSSVFSNIGIGFFLGGSLSNALDRLFHGGVLDFIYLGFGPRFNLADIAIVGGMIIILRQTVFFCFHRETIK